MSGSGRQPFRLFFALLAAACLLLPVSPAAAIDVTGPMTISEPGTYVLVQDITSTLGRGIGITASDVVFDGQGHLIDGNQMDGPGIWIPNGSTPVTNVTIRNVRLSNWANWSYGLSLRGVTHSAIQGVTTTGNEIGIQLGPGCTENTVTNCTVSDCEGGIFLASCDLNTVSDNTLAGNTMGIYLFRSSENTIRRNTVTGNTSPADFSTGLYLQSYTTMNTIRENTITGNTWGILFPSGPISGNTISENTVTGNDHGLDFGTGRPALISGNTIVNNNFNNPQNTYFNSPIGVNAWNTTPAAGTNIVGGSSLGGNFWGSPDGTGYSQTHPDGNNDGFCDAPYIIETNNTDHSPLHVATPPSITAGFYAFGHVGQAPYPVRFLDRSTGSPTAWTWDFGDGSTSTEQSPTHIYNQTGAYTVALTTSNDLASDTSIQYRCIIVNTVPAANFTANATSGSTPFSVQFTDQSSDANGYQWQFGDGTTSTEQNPVHTYTTPGSYTVTLVASGADYGSVFMQ
ncbi:NosD domain-containing protein [Methanosphaerula subterraneus]